VRRLGHLASFAIVLAVMAPAVAASSETPASCGGAVRSGRTSVCVRAIVIPHFNAKDAIDYSSLVARIDSPHAKSWRVTGSLADARGVVYFAWYCSASRSTVTMRSDFYVGKSCEATRKTVRVRRNGRTYTQYYVADTSRPQRLRVTAHVGSCVPTGIRGCRFEAKATYLLAG